MSVLKFSELEKLGMPLLRQGAEDLGFRKAPKKRYFYNKYIYLKEITPTAEYFLGFSTGKPYPGHCMINPTIGITQKGIAELFEEITGVACVDEGVYRSLGYFTPKNTYIEWDLGLGDIPTITDDLLTTLKTYGLPELERMLDLRYFAEKYRKYGYCAKHYLPVIYYKLGEYDKCLEYMEESLALLDKIPSLFRIPVDYHEFYDKMVALMKAAKV